MARGRNNRGRVGRIARGRGRGARQGPLPPSNASPHLPAITPPVELQSTPEHQPEVMRPVQSPSVASSNVASTAAENASTNGSSQQCDSQAQTSVTGGQHQIPTDPPRTNRKWVTVDRGILVPSADCSRRIRSIFKERSDDDGARWVLVSNETKEFYFEEFKKYFYWNPAIDHLVKKAWLTNASIRYGDMICRLKKRSNRPKYVPESVWTKWKEAWRKPDVVRMSQQNAKNRRGGVEGGLCSSTHNGGSISHFEHGKRLEKQYDRPPTPFEVFRRTHTKKGDGQTFTSDKAREINDRFIALVEERSGLKRTTLDENHLYYEAAGGAKKSRVYGLGSQASYYYTNASSKACHASNAHNAREINEKLQATISSIRAEIEQKVDEMVDERMHQREEELRVDFEARFQRMQRQFQEQMQQMLASRPLAQPTARVVYSSSDET